MKKLLTPALVILGIISLIVAFIYFSETAGSLPHYFLGYAKDSAHKHTKHGVAFVGLALILFVGAWMTTGQPKKNLPTEKSDSADS